MYYLKNQNFTKARETGEQYIAKTLAYSDFFESYSMTKFKRTVNQIYLCHDNQLNADFLFILVDELRKRKYEFVSLKEAMADPIYDQNNHYFKKWGISWFYRWLKTEHERKNIMKQEPSNEKINEFYQNIL